MATTTYSWATLNPQFVNTIPTGNQTDVAVAGLANGNFFCAWTDPFTGDVRARIMGADGNPITNEFAVNSTLTDTQSDPSVIGLANGNVVVAFTDASGDYGTNIRLRIFNSAGQPLGNDFLVYQSIFDQRWSDIAALADGGFVVTYLVDSGSDNVTGFRVFNSDGSLRADGGAVVGSLSDANRASVTELVGGNLVLAVDYPQYQVDPTYTKTFFRRLDANAHVIGGSTSIGDIGTINTDIQVAGLPDGGFVVAYTDDGWDIDGTEITVRIYNANGTARTDYIRANTDFTGDQQKPSLTVLSNGFFVVSWSDGTGFMWMQAYNPNGAAIGSNTAVNSQVVEGEIAALSSGFVAGVRSSTLADAGADNSIRSSVSELSRTIIGDGTSETLTGDSLRDTINAGGGNDIIISGGGNDTIDGGANVDKVTFPGQRSQYTLNAIAGAGNGVQVVGLNSTATLSNVEQLEFTDQIVNWNNTMPIATAGDHGIQLNEYAQVAPRLSYSDPNGLPVVQYQLFDGGAAANSGYFWTPGNLHYPAQTYLDVAAADIGSIWAYGGQANGSETWWVRAFNGTDWTSWDPFTLTTYTNTAPVAAVGDHNVHVNQWVTLSQWLATSDVDGDTITQYEFLDAGLAGNSGYFWTADVGQRAANEYFTVDAADLATTWVRGGQAVGSETMWVRAFDGTDWSAWDAFTLTSQNAAPFVAALNPMVHVNAWMSMQSVVFFKSDADGDPITQYQFLDAGTAAGSGYIWTADIGQQPADTYITVNAADLGTTWVRGGQVTGSDLMWVRVFDGTDWSAWDFIHIDISEHAAGRGYRQSERGHR